jgi:hypothetical protein
MRSSREVDEITQADIWVRNMKINTIIRHVSSHFFFSFLGGYRVGFASERIRETYVVHAMSYLTILQGGRFMWRHQIEGYRGNSSQSWV